MVMIPGGLVPPEHYVATVKAVQTIAAPSLRLYVAIVECLANLCDPVIDLNARIMNAISVAKQSINFNASATPNDIVIFGHSLGGIGARFFVDTRLRDFNESYRGLGMFGVFANGDDENVSGSTLGYPLHLAKYHTSLLALAGELDFTPISNTAILYRQWTALAPSEQDNKAVVVIPSMDHSDFCPGFHVKNDIASELSPAVATAQIANVTASWLAVLTLGQTAAPSAAATLRSYALASAPMLSPFLQAAALDTTWCNTFQLWVADQQEFSTRVRIANTTYVNGNLALTTAHTSYSKSADGALLINNVAYLEYQGGFKPTNAGPLQIACKGISRARVESELSGL